MGQCTSIIKKTLVLCLIISGNVHGVHVTTPKPNIGGNLGEGIGNGLGNFLAKKAFKTKEEEKFHNKRPSCPNQSNQNDIQIAVELCVGDNNADEGFIYSKNLLNKYVNNGWKQGLLRELMTMCLVSDRYLNDAVENANDVLKTSSEPLSIGCAWFHKGRFAAYEGEYNEALVNYKIALKILEKVPNTSQKIMESLRNFYLCACHLYKGIAYRNLGETEKANKEEVIAKSFIDADKKI